MPPPLRSAAAFGIGYRCETAGDLPFVAALYASTRTEEIAQTGWPPAMQATFLRQQHQAQHAHYRAQYDGAEWLIVERAGVPVGRLYLWESGAETRVIDISLIPAARGAGIGEAILRDVLAMAAEQGRKTVIHVGIHNPARRLYRRLGFVVAENLGVYDRMEARPQ